MENSNKTSLLEELKGLLQKDERFTAEGQLLKNIIVEHALKLDKDLVKRLLSNKRLKEHFFCDIDGTLVFDKDKFISFVDNKQFLPDSYTAFKNKIGLTLDGKDDYLKERKDVTLVWPYKDCVLEGGQTKEDQKRDEIFWNETLAPDEIDRLFEPKVLMNFKRFDKDGEHKVSEIKDTDNLIIKGNNLLALHSLKKRFAGKVKLIYIDPPYNIGGDSFQYNDSFKHSSWLSFMKNRLMIAKELLSANGAIFVQIDHHEVAYLNVLLDEIFGTENKVQIIAVKVSAASGFKAVNPGPIDVTEYILFYAKNKNQFPFRLSYAEADYHPNYNLYLERDPNDKENTDKWKFVPLKKKVLESNGYASEKEAKEELKNNYNNIIKNMIADFAYGNAEDVVSIRDFHKPSQKVKELQEKSKNNKDKIFSIKKQDGTFSYVYRGGAVAFYSSKIKNIDGQPKVTELLSNFWTHISWAGIAREGDVRLKNGKKPEKLIKQILEIGTNENDLVMDFHLGSGTTAAVAHKMGRQYIGIEQLDYGKNDSVVRLKNVIGKTIKKRDKLVSELEYDTSGISRAVNWQGGGDFVYCELLKWNEAYIDKIQRAKAKADLAKIWAVMKETAHISYKLDLKEFDKNAKEFEQLKFEDQRRFLLEVLDKNQLYVNYCEIDDTDYNVSEEDKKLNRLFYGG